MLDTIWLFAITIKLPFSFVHYLPIHSLCYCFLGFFTHTISYPVKRVIQRFFLSFETFPVLFHVLCQYTHSIIFLIKMGLSFLENQMYYWSCFIMRLLLILEISFIQIVFKYFIYLFIYFYKQIFCDQKYLFYFLNNSGLVLGIDVMLTVYWLDIVPFPSSIGQSNLMKNVALG